MDFFKIFGNNKIITLCFQINIMSSIIFNFVCVQRLPRISILWTGLWVHRLFGCLIRNKRTFILISHNKLKPRLLWGWTLTRAKSLSKKKNTCKLLLYKPFCRLTPIKTIKLFVCYQKKKKMGWRCYPT